jgi:putative Mg2+ transporter-C (MgtC) family protein
MEDMLEPALRLAAAVFIGGLVGVNRDLYGKPTGLRTHALVALGAALAVMSSTEFGLIQSDANAVSRAIQGVMGGIGFLGAGVILRAGDGQRVVHTATAASIWVTAALGIVCGIGAWRIAVLAVIGVTLILVLGSAVDRVLYGRLKDSDS